MELYKEYTDMGLDLATIFLENEDCRPCIYGKFINLEKNFDVICEVVNTELEDTSQMNCLNINRSAK